MLPASGGVVIVGDSIASGLGKMVGGVPCQSWGQWLAEALNLSFTRHAQGGAPVAQIRAELLPRVTGRYDIACLAAGTNDTVGQRDPRAVERDVAAIIGPLSDRAEQVIVIGLPPRLNLLGTRTKPERIVEVNEILLRTSEAVHATFVPLDWFEGRRLFRGDMVHPSAFGHLAIADAAAAALGIEVQPSSLAHRQGSANRTPLEKIVYAAEYARALERSLVKWAHDSVAHTL